MKTFLRYLPFLREIHRSPVDSPHKGQWRGALMFSLICACIIAWAENWDAGDLRRNRVYYENQGVSWTSHLYNGILVRWCLCFESPHKWFFIATHHIYPHISAYIQLYGWYAKIFNSTFSSTITSLSASQNNILVRARATYYLWLSKVLANERIRYITYYVSFQRLRPCSAINRNWPWSSDENHKVCQVTRYDQWRYALSVFTVNQECVLVAKPRISSSIIVVLGNRFSIKYDNGRPTLYPINTHKNQILLCLSWLTPSNNNTIDPSGRDIWVKCQ